MDQILYERVCKHFHRIVGMSLDKRNAEIAAIRASDKDLADEVEQMLGGDQSAREADFLECRENEETLACRNNDDAAFQPDSLVGKSLRHYQIEGKIGEGGMGVVYRAYDPHGDRHVAIKIIRDAALSDKEQLNRFRSEAKAAAQLQHPGIVPVYDIGRDGNNEFFSMALIRGTDLRAAIRAPEAMDQRFIATVCRDIAQALDYAHSRGIVHRDVKPANILLDVGGSPMLTDFGLAKRLAADAEQTSTGQIMGTLVHAAPEQLADAKHVGPAADIYGLGASMYECLTGTPPYFGCNDLIELINRKRDESPAPPKTMRPNVDDDLQVICMRCLQKDPADRYATAAQLADDLERYLQGEPVSHLSKWRGIQRAIGFRKGRQGYLSAGASRLLPIQTLVHPTIFVLVWWELHPAFLWILLAVLAVASTVNNYYYHWRLYWRLSPTERQSGILIFAFNIAFACLFFIHGPTWFDQEIKDFLNVYPPLCLLAGVAICAHAVTHSGRWILYAAIFFPLSLIVAHLPNWGPLIFGVAGLLIALVIDRDLRDAGTLSEIREKN
jgi:serine/threonine protein kinase